MTKDTEITHFNRLEGVTKVIQDLMGATEKPLGYHTTLQEVLDQVRAAQGALSWSPEKASIK